ncbi:hypothetical protein BGW80DRAFT_1357844 [Lactifluus volemus]|nr:hypothetical protein BGW80DRAFT_1357844 [Lactifluus volemus]
MDTPAHPRRWPKGNFIGNRDGRTRKMIFAHTHQHRIRLGTPSVLSLTTVATRNNCMISI